MAKHLHFKACVGAMHVAFQCKSKLERANQSFSRVQMFLKIISNSRFDLKGKIGIERKTRQNAENKQTFDMTRKIGVERKTRQTTENKQIFDLTG